MKMPHDEEVMAHFIIPRILNIDEPLGVCMSVLL